MGVRGVGTVSPSASRRQPSPRITSRPRAPGHPPARAGPRLSRPLGRNPLSAGEWSPLGVLGPPGAPGLLTKRGKEDSTQGGTTHSNHKQYQEGRPSERPHTDLHRRPHVSAPICRGTKHYNCTAGLYGGATVSPSAPRRQPPPRSTSRPRAPGHPLARAGPLLPHPIGRSHLSAEKSPLGSWAYSWRHCPWLLRKRRKQD